MEKYGFIYIWRDRKHKRHYIGSHWGSETDGYICSSDWMRKAYKRRPPDFKRRVVSRVYSNRVDLLAEEERWLSMIKPEEVKKRYYNLKFGSQNHWTAMENKLSIGAKISRHMGVLSWYTDGKRDYRIRETDDIPNGFVRGRKPGRVFSEEAKIRKRGWHHTEESKCKLREKALKYFENPQARLEASEFAKKGWGVPDAHLAHSERMKKKWDNLDARLVQSETLKRVYDRPEAHLAQSAAVKKSWDTRRKKQQLKE